MEISATKIDTYLMCPAKYFWRYVQHVEPEEIAAPLAFGSAVHGTIKHVYRRLMAGQRLSAEEAESAFAQDWETQCCVPIRFSNGSTPEQLQEQGIGLIRAYLEAMPDMIVPVAVEQELRAPVVNLVTGETIPDTTIHGILDRIEPGNRPVELKTSSQSWSQFRADITLQFSVYSYLIAYLSEADEVEGNFEIIVKTKMPKFQRLTTRRTARDFDRLYRILQSVMRGIESKIFHPNPSHMYCPSCDYCSQCASW